MRNDNFWKIVARMLLYFTVGVMIPQAFELGIAAYAALCFSAGVGIAVSADMCARGR